MKLLETFISDIENVENVEEIKSFIEEEFDEYPHIVKGFTHYIDELSKDNSDYLDDFKQDIIDLLNEVNNLSKNEIEALELAADDQGPWYFNDTVDIINRGDYIYFPGVEDDYDLGKANINMFGSVKDAVSKEDWYKYIDIDKVAEMFMENNQTEEDEDMDYEDWYRVAEEEVENNPEEFIDDFFDYESWGRDLRMEGYFFGDGGAILVL